MDYSGSGKTGDLKRYLGMVIGSLKFPVTKQHVMEAIDRVPGFPVQAREWVEDELPEGTYDSLDDLREAVGL